MAILNYISEETLNREASQISFDVPDDININEFRITIIKSNTLNKSSLYFYQVSPYIFTTYSNIKKTSEALFISIKVLYIIILQAMIYLDSSP